MFRHLGYAVYVILALLTFASANFDLYRIDDVGWQIHNVVPDWLGVAMSPIWKDTNDLSHGRLGIECKGCSGPQMDVNKIISFEMHFTNKPLWHFTTFYADSHDVDGTSRWWLRGMDGRSYGECFLYPDKAMNYKWSDCNGKHDVNLYRKLRCLTLSSASEIMDAWKEETGWDLCTKGADQQAARNSTAALSKI